MCSEEVCICKKSLISSQVGVFAGVEKSQPSTLHFTGAGAIVVKFVITHLLDFKFMRTSLSRCSLKEGMTISQFLK